MKKRLRSVLASFLAALLLLTTLPLSVFADGVELPVVMFEEDGSISDEAYAYLYDTANFTNAYFYGGFDGYWQTYLVQAAYGDEEASQMIREQDGIYYILADVNLIQMVFGEFFPAPLDFVTDTVLPAMRDGEGLGDIPAYNEETGEYLVQAISLELLWDDSYVYYGFIDNGDGTGSFYFAEIEEWEDDEPVLSGAGTEIVLRPTEEGIEFVSRRELDELPEEVDRDDIPEFHFREFDYQWGFDTADFLEDYREEYLKQNISRILYDCAIYNEQFDDLEDGVATLNWDQMAWVYDCCFGECSPVSYINDEKIEYFDGTFVLDVAAGNINGITYVVDLEDPDDEGYFTVENTEPVNDRLHYDYRGWIESEDGDGGEFFFAKIEDAWFDEETGETRVEYGEGGIRVELKVIDGRMTEMAYEYVETLPPDEAYSPEPGPSEEEEFEREKRTAEFVEEYYYEYLTASVGSEMLAFLEEEAPDRVNGEEAVLEAREFEELFWAVWGDMPRGFLSDVVIKDAKAGDLGGVAYDEATETFTVSMSVGMGQQNYCYRGWTHEDGCDVFWFFKISGIDENGCFYPTPDDPSGVKVVLRSEEGDYVLESHEIVDAIPDVYDPEPGQDEPGHEPSFEERFDWEKRTADFVAWYYYDLFLPGYRFYCETDPARREADGTLVAEPEEFEEWFRDVFRDMPRDFYEDVVEPAAKEGVFECMTYEEDTDTFIFCDGEFDPIPAYYDYAGWIQGEDGDDAFYYRIVEEWIGDEPVFGEGGYEIVVRMEGYDVVLISQDFIEEFPEDFDPEPQSGHDDDFKRRAAEFVEEFYFEYGSLNLCGDILRWYGEVLPSAVVDDSVTISARDFEIALENVLGDRPVNFIEDYLIPDAKRGALNGIRYDEATDSFTVLGGGGDGERSYCYRGWTNEEDGVDAFWFFKVAGVDENGNFYPDPSDPSGVKVLLRPVGDEYELVEATRVDALPDHFNDEPGPEPRSFDYHWGRSTAEFLEEYYDEYALKAANLSGMICNFAINEWGLELEGDSADTVFLTEDQFREAFERTCDAPAGFFEDVLLPAVKSGEFDEHASIGYNAENNTFSVHLVGFGLDPNYAFCGWIESEDHNGGEYYFGEVLTARYIAEESRYEYEFGPTGIRVTLHVENGRMILDAYDKGVALPDVFDPEPGEPGPEPGPGYYVPEDPYNPDLYIEGDWNYDVVDDKAIIIRYLNETATDVAIPDFLGGHTVVGIGGRAFMDRDAIETLYIPASVTDIGGDSFFACSGLTTIILAQDMDPQDNRTVNGCLINNRDVLVAAVKGTVEVPGAKHIGDGSLTGRVTERAFISSETEDIGNYAFAFSDDLREVMIPDSVTRISDCAFKDCGALEIISYNGSPDDWSAVEIGAGNELEDVDVVFTEKIFVGNNVSIIAPNGVAPRGTRLSGDEIERLPNEEKDRLPEGFEKDSAFRVIAELGIDHETEQGYEATPIELNQDVTVGVKIPEELQDKYLVAIWLPEEGDPVILEGRSTDDGYFLFNTDKLGVFVLTEPTLVGTAVRPGEPETVYEAGETITIRQDETLLLSFRQKFAEYDLVPGWRNDLLNEQGFTCADEPVMIGDVAHAQITAGELPVGATGTLTVGWYRFDDVFGENAVGWQNAVPVYTCTFTLEVLVHETHSFGEVTYIWAEDNSTCTAARACACGETETETVDAASVVKTPATCEGKGTTTYTAAFTNAAFTAQTKDVDDIPAAGHAWGEVTYTWSDDNSTCTASRICANDASHVETETVNSSSNVKVPAGCTTAGTTAYTATFTNAAFAQQTKDVEDIPAAGHAWGEATYTWAEDNSTCTAARACACGETETETVETTAVTEGDKTTYTATFTNPAFTEQTREEGGEEPEILWGDANGDGVISNKDIVRLKNYLANYDEDTGLSTVILFPGADANGDGIVSNKDIVRLKNYLANYDEEAGTSTYTLGPAN